MWLKKILLPLLLPVALLGSVSAVVWFIFTSGWDVAVIWLENQIEELK